MRYTFFEIYSLKNIYLHKNPPSNNNTMILKFLTISLTLELPTIKKKYKAYIREIRESL